MGGGESNRCNSGLDVSAEGYSQNAKAAAPALSSQHDKWLRRVSALAQAGKKKSHSRHPKQTSADRRERHRSAFLQQWGVGVGGLKQTAL